jgi:hypothetical protein
LRKNRRSFLVKRKWWLYSWLSSLANLYRSSTSFSWLHHSSHWEYRVIWTGLAELTDRRSLQEAELQPLHLAELPMRAFHIPQNFSHPQRLCTIPAIAKDSFPQHRQVPSQSVRSIPVAPELLLTVDCWRRGRKTEW